MRFVESCCPDEHHATEKNFGLSSESEALSDEETAYDYFFEGFSDIDFLYVEEPDVNDARIETYFAVSFNSVACNVVTSKASKIGVNIKASKNDMSGAWSLTEFKTEDLDD